MKADDFLLAPAFFFFAEGRELVTVILPDSPLGFCTYANKREREIVLASCGIRDYKTVRNQAHNFLF